MEKEKEIQERLSSFLKHFQRQGFASSTMRRKERSVLLFQRWILEEKKEPISPKKVSQKIFEDFEKYLKKKDLKKQVIDSHKKGVADFLHYAGNKEIFLQKEPKKEKENDIQKIVNFYFQTKGFSLEEIKKNARKEKIIYSRYTRPAKDLLHLAGSVEEAKKAITKVAAWASSRNLDYAIETVFKKWPEINKLKPKEKKQTPYFRGNPMVWSKNKKKWFVIDNQGEWLEFAGDEKEIEWKTEEN